MSVTQPVIVNKYFDIVNLTIWGESSDDGRKTPRLTFGFRNGQPRFIVNTGVTGIEGLINFPCDAINMTIILNDLKEMANANNGEQISVSSLSAVYENDKPTNAKRTVATLHAGKTKDGVLYLCVIAEGKDKIVFSFKPSQYHVFMDKEKNAISVAEYSKKCAVAVADLLLEVVAKVLLQHSIESYETGAKKSADVKQAKNPNSAANANIQSLDDFDIA